LGGAKNPQNQGKIRGLCARKIADLGRKAV